MDEQQKDKVESKKTRLFKKSKLRKPSFRNSEKFPDDSLPNSKYKTVDEVIGEVK